MEDTETRHHARSVQPGLEQNYAIPEHHSLLPDIEHDDVSSLHESNSPSRSSSHRNPPTLQNAIMMRKYNPPPSVPGEQPYSTRIGKTSMASTKWWWWWEIGSALLSVACVGAVTAVLRYIENKTIEEWGFSIAPNSLIAILTTISKAAMMVVIASCISQLKWSYFSKNPRLIKDLDRFDEASRGPWGSLIFLSSVRIRSITASALALVTILALGIEPSAQQILEISTRNEVLQGAEPSIPYADSYSSKGASFELNPRKVSKLDPWKCDRSKMELRS
jgi:hypothetical protein